MATTRLTNDLRDRIYSKMLSASVFTKRKETLEAVGARLAEELRVFYLGGSYVARNHDLLQQKMKDMYVSIPEEVRSGTCDMFYTRDDISLWRSNNYGDRITINFSGKLNEAYRDRVVKISPRCGKAFLNTVPKTLFNGIVNYAASVEKYNNDVHAFRVDAYAILNSTTTITKLLKSYPFLEKHVPIEQQQKVDNLPAVQLDSFKQLLETA